MTSRILAVLTLAVLIAGCGRRPRVALPPPAAAPTADVLLERGLTAFHEGTPESYARAAGIFREAWTLKADRCDDALNLAQSLLFLATEQLLNWEEYEPRQKEAVAVLDSTEPGCRSSHEAFVLRLRALIAGRGPTATALINRAIELDPADAMNWLVLGYLDGLGRWAAMARARELKPGSALIQFELGASRSDADAARQALQRAIELSPRHFRAHLNLAYSADENVDVEPIFRKVVEIAPDFLEGRLAFGNYYGSLDEIERAAEQYLAALAVNPRYDTAYFRLGVLMFDAERLKEAEQHFRSAVGLNPGSYEAYYYLGNILLYGRNEYDEAKRLYEQALKVRVNYAEAEYGIGWVHRMQSRPDSAVTQFDRAIRLQSRYGDAYLSRGDIRAERRQFAEALADYQKAIESYEERVKALTATIAFAEARSRSPVMQAEKKRAEREKARLDALLERVRRYKSEIEQTMMVSRP